MFIPYELLDAKAAHSLKQKARARGDIDFSKAEKQEQSGGAKKAEEGSDGE
eukprot:gene30915-38207_t